MQKKYYAEPCADCSTNCPSWGTCKAADEVAMVLDGTSAARTDAIRAEVEGIEQRSELKRIRVHKATSAADPSARDQRLVLIAMAVVIPLYVVVLLALNIGTKEQLFAILGS